MAGPEREKWLSASQLFVLSECGEMYRQRYVLKRKGPRGVRMLIGLAVHDAVAADLHSKMANNGALLELQTVLNKAETALVNHWNAGDVNVPEGQTKEEAWDEALLCVQDYAGYHHLQVAPLIKPASVETEHMITIKNFTFDVALKVDITETDGTIRDTKTTMRTPNENAAAVSLQLQLYGLHAKLKTGVVPPRLVLDYLVRTKTGKLSYHERATGVSHARQRQCVSMLARAGAVVEAGAFMPNPGSFLCSKKFCEFAQMGTCDFWSGKE